MALPYFEKNELGIRLIVDGKPMLLRCGELRNSTSSSIEHLRPLWQSLKNMGVNSVIATFSWDLFEPEEGVFAYKLIDVLISDAEE